MEIFDFLNHYLSSHPDMMSQLEYAFRIKWWCLLLIAFYFIYLAENEIIKKKKNKPKPSDKDNFLA